MHRRFGVPFCAMCFLAWRRPARWDRGPGCRLAGSTRPHPRLRWLSERRRVYGNRDCPSARFRRATRSVRASLDIGKEPRAIDGTVEDTRSSHAVIAQRGQKSRRLPVTERRVGDEPLASFTSPVARRHVGRGPGLVDKNKPLRVKAFLHLAPGGAGVLDIRAFLLGGMQSFMGWPAPPSGVMGSPEVQPEG